MEKSSEKKLVQVVPLRTWLIPEIPEYCKQKLEVIEALTVLVVAVAVAAAAAAAAASSLGRGSCSLA